MAKKNKSWFNLVKSLFIWDTHSTQEKKEKRRKWIFGKLKTKKLPSITAPATTSNEAEEEGKTKHSQVVMLNEVSQSGYQKDQDGSEESEPVETRNGVPRSIYLCQREIQEFAAIKIQTAFRGYLAKKALRALKGIVKLQAIIRGRAVRRQAMSTLKSLQSIVSIQSKICARRLQMVEGRWDSVEDEETLYSKDKIIRMDSNSERKWDDNTLLKEEVDACCMIKKEGIIKRERIKEYTFNHRRSAESERSKVNGRWRYWLEQWVDTQFSKSKELEGGPSALSEHNLISLEDGEPQYLYRALECLRTTSSSCGWISFSSCIKSLESSPGISQSSSPSSSAW
ncbi:unnamed protein product [Vicia faba]|uniref:Protein IQ-DOMAIN 14 n=1 Tax=Vicia faba TaxID=3906 RepID=A0AAV0YLK3_VICFA|nr:unnamed protein product [Vicia faba]